MWVTITNSISSVLQPGLFAGADAGAALVVLILGWVVALLVRKAVITLSRLMGVDVIFRRLRIRDEADGRRIADRPSRVLGALAHWTTILFALMIALDILEVDGAVALLQRGIARVPALVVAVAILALGIHLAGFLAALSEDAARAIRLPLAGLVGGVVRLAIIGMVLLITLEQLGLTGPMTTAGFLLILGALPITAVLAFGIGGRELAANVLAAQMLRAQFRCGDRFEGPDVTGTILCIGWGHTRIQCEDGTLIVPNTRMTAAIARRTPGDQAK